MTDALTQHSARTREAKLTIGSSVPRSSRLTWAQQKTWRDIHNLLPEWKPFYTLTTRVPIEPALPLSELSGRLEALLAGHESLRTFYLDGPDGLTQSVGPAGQVSVHVVDVTGLDDDRALAQVEKVEAELVRRPFDHGAGYPVRAVAVERDGYVSLVTLMVSHVSADVASMQVLHEHLTQLCIAADVFSTDDEFRSALQPIDLAGFEASEAGEMLNQRSLAHLRRVYKAIPATMFTRRYPAGSPRFCQGELRSAALPGAVAEVARRSRSTTSAVLMAAAASALREVLGVEQCFFAVLNSNRVAAELRWAVCSIAQSMAVTFPVPDSLEQAARNAMMATMKAHRFARFDPAAAAALVGTVGRERGETLDVEYRFNDLRSPSTMSTVPPRGSAAGRPAETTFQWLPGTDIDEISFFVDVYDAGPKLAVSVLADTRLMPPHQVEDFLYRMENVVLRSS